jgi:hypothetical protein
VVSPGLVMPPPDFGVFVDPLPRALLQRSRFTLPLEMLVKPADRLGLQAVPNGLVHARYIGSIADQFSRLRYRTLTRRAAAWRGIAWFAWRWEKRPCAGAFVPIISDDPLRIEAKGDGSLHSPSVTRMRSVSKRWLSSSSAISRGLHKSDKNSRHDLEMPAFTLQILQRCRKNCLLRFKIIF